MAGTEELFDRVDHTRPPPLPPWLGATAASLGLVSGSPRIEADRFRNRKRVSDDASAGAGREEQRGIIGLGANETCDQEQQAAKTRSQFRLQAGSNTPEQEP